MQKFSELQQNTDLHFVLKNELGSLYRMTTPTPFQLGRDVRHFDSDIPANMISDYTQLWYATAEWVEAHEDLLAVIRIKHPTDIGKDFVIWQTYAYTTSLWSYDESNNPPEQPKALLEMRQLLKQYIGNPINQQEKLIETVLEQSLLNSSKKTYPEGEADGQLLFVVAEPQITVQDIKMWSSYQTSKGNI